MAFIVVQHLDPKHHSILSELLARETSMKVSEVKDGMTVEPNQIYVIPPDASMSISDHVLRIAPRGESVAGRMSVDHFMRSLAESQANRAIGIILSGTGTDGTLGLAEIRAQGGVTFAQDPQSARYDGMPRSAIDSGAADFIRAPRAPSVYFAQSRPGNRSGFSHRRN
jgi:two-component system CheB/CheR fusion protein